MQTQATIDILDKLRLKLALIDNLIKQIPTQQEPELDRDFFDGLALYLADLGEGIKSALKTIQNR